MPTVGLTACRQIEDYRQAVLHVGGEVRVLQPGADVADVLAAIDGLLLSGGEDVAPARYGERPHPSVVDVNLERDAFEIALIEGVTKVDVELTSGQVSVESAAPIDEATVNAAVVEAGYAVAP